LITDFGNTDNYAGVVRGVIKKLNPEVEIIDVTHGVVSYSVLNAQYMLYTSVRYFPENTVFCVVVDPGVGTRRRAIVGCGGGFSVVAPDNGIISSILCDSDAVFSVNNNYFGNVSSTFHGRDVFAPVAALLAKGVSPVDFGTRVDDWIRKPFPEYNVKNKVVEGIVLHVDKFGNVITSVPNNSFVIPGDAICTFSESGKSFALKLCNNYYELKQGVSGVLQGSSGFWEMAMNMESLAGVYSIKIEDRLSISI
jgi:S-adenosylmethionine hydrolase